MRFRLTTIAILPLVLSLTYPVFAQQEKKRLNQIAGSIRIKNPDGGDVVISDRDYGPTGQTHGNPAGSYGKCIGQKSHIFRKELMNLRHSVRSGEEVSSSLWYATFIRQCNVVIGFSGFFEECNPGKVWLTQKHQELLRVVASCIETVRGLTSSSWGSRLDLEQYSISGPKFALARHAATRLDQLIPQYDAAVKALEDVVVPVVAPKKSNRMRILEGIALFCSQSRPDRGNEYQECCRSQEEAHTRLMERDARQAAVSQAIFDSIRDECMIQWNNDYRNRDECERRLLNARRP